MERTIKAHVEINGEPCCVACHQVIGRSRTNPDLKAFLLWVSGTLLELGIIVALLK